LNTATNEAILPSTGGRINIVSFREVVLAQTHATPMMPSNKRLLLIFAAVLFPVCSALAANSCQQLGVDPAGLRNGQMFVRTTAGWSEFSSLDALNIQRRVQLHLAYVIRTFGTNDRTGILVIKSNRPAKSDDSANLTKRILLTRQGVTADVGCAPLKYLPNEQVYVSTDAYVDYHDYPAPDTPALRQDGKAIEAFHFEYQSDTQKRCIRTDDPSWDSFPFNRSSNRAQFSFDRYVVANGSYTVVGLFLFHIPSPFDANADNRTEVKKYSTSGNLACVEFFLPVDSADYTLRINDLEGRELPPLIRRLPEKQWPQ
jgi:hypothetical protein